MRLHDLNINEQSRMARRIRELLAGGEPAGLDETTRAMMIDKYETLPDEIDAVTAELESLKAQVKAKSAQSMQLKERAVRVNGQMRDWLHAISATDDVYKLFGFDPPVRGRTQVIAETPTELTAMWTPDGNKLKYKGNNKTGSITYMIARREGDSAEWIFCGHSRKQDFLDKNIRPGVSYEYKVQAQAAKNKSDFSNTVVVGP